MIDSCKKCMFFRPWDEEGNWGLCRRYNRKVPKKGEYYCYLFVEGGVVPPDWNPWGPMKEEKEKDG